MGSRYIELFRSDLQNFRSFMMGADSGRDRDRDRDPYRHRDRDRDFRHPSDRYDDPYGYMRDRDPYRARDSYRLPDVRDVASYGLPAHGFPRDMGARYGGGTDICIKMLVCCMRGVAQTGCNVLSVLRVFRSLLRTRISFRFSEVPCCDVCVGLRAASYSKRFCPRRWCVAASHSQKARRW